jgi:hypothetical protein
MILDLFLLHVFDAPPYCSFTSNLTTCFTVLVQLVPQHEVASRTHRSTVNWIFTVFSLIIEYWIDNGICSVFIMIIINLIIDKSILCYKITIKYWQNVPYSQLCQNKTPIKNPQKKSAYFTHPDFSGAKIEKKCANYASKFGTNKTRKRKQASFLKSQGTKNKKTTKHCNKTTWYQQQWYNGNSAHTNTKKRNRMRVMGIRSVGSPLWEGLTDNTNPAGSPAVHSVGSPP